MASWWESHKHFKRRPYEIAYGRELPPFPKVSTTTALPFVFSDSELEYRYNFPWHFSYEKLHVPTKLVRSVPLAWAFSRSCVENLGHTRAAKHRRNCRYAALAALYAVYYIATTDNFLRKAVEIVDILCTGLVSTGFFNSCLHYITSAVGAVDSVIRFLVYGVPCGLALAVRLATKLVSSSYFDPYTRYTAVVDEVALAEPLTNLLLYDVPNNFYCVGTFWMTFVFVDTMLLLFYFVGFAGLPGRYSVPLYGYVLLKVVTFILPLLYVSPNDRLYFWIIVLIVLAVEVVLTINFCWVVNYGFRWEFSRRTVYRNWGKHFKYQIPTSNSNMYRNAVAWYIYPIVKCYFFGLDAFCSTLPGYGPWLKLESKRWSYREIFPELYFQRVYEPQVGTSGFATRGLPLGGFKTPTMIEAEAAYARNLAAWKAVALDCANKGLLHHDRAVRLWTKKWAPYNKLLKQLQTGNAGKPGSKVNTAIHIEVRTIESRLMLEQPLDVAAYVAYYQAHRKVPMELRYARRTIYPDTRRTVNPYVSGYFENGVPFFNRYFEWKVDNFTRLVSAAEFSFELQRKPRRKASRASFLPEPSYFNALLEQDTAVNLKYGILFILAISSLTVYSIILAGWSSNSKYAFIGALRSAAQMISYEVAISLLLLPVVLMAGSLNIAMIVYMQSITVWFLFPLFPAAILFVIAMLAETNRTPFDLPEAEAELVAGYNVDYSALPFAMFFLGEYCNMILISTLFCLLFLGGWTFCGHYGVLILVIKAVAAWFYFIHVRATLPRYRYDQLMDNGWKIFLPIAGGLFVFMVGLLTGLDALPVTTELPLQEISRFIPVRADCSQGLVSLAVMSSTLRESLNPEVLEQALYFVRRALAALAGSRNFWALALVIGYHLLSLRQAWPSLHQRVRDQAYAPAMFVAVSLALLLVTCLAELYSPPNLPPANFDALRVFFVQWGLYYAPPFIYLVSVPLVWLQVNVVNPCWNFAYTWLLNLVRELLFHLGAPHRFQDPRSTWWYWSIHLLDRLVGCLIILGMGQLVCGDIGMPWHYTEDLYPGELDYSTIVSKDLRPRVRQLFQLFALGHAAVTLLGYRTWARWWLGLLSGVVLVLIWVYFSLQNRRFPEMGRETVQKVAGLLGLAACIATAATGISSIFLFFAATLPPHLPVSYPGCFCLPQFLLYLIYFALQVLEAQFGVLCVGIWVIAFTLFLQYLWRTFKW